MGTGWLHAFGTARRRRIAPAAVILLAAIAFFWPFIGEGKVFLAADTLSEFHPWRSSAPPGFRPHNTLITDPVNHNWAALYNRQLKEGDLQNWNPYLLTGIPATGASAMSGMSGRNYPPKLLAHRFLDTATAHSLLLLFHVLMAGLAMHALLAALGAGPAGSVFGAIAWMFNGSELVWLEFETTAAMGAWAPLVLLCLEKLRATRSPRWAAAGGVAIGGLILAGHLQFLVYTMLLVGAYLLWSLARTLRGEGGRPATLRLLGGSALALGLGLLIGAVDLVPLAELLRTSGRIERSFEFRSFFDTLGRVPWRWYVTLAFPDWFGSPPLRLNAIPRLPTQEYMNYCELTFYAGVPTLFAFLAACAAPWRGARAFFIPAAAVTAALMGGTLLYWPFFHLVPGMDRMNPTRLVWLFDLVLALVAGLGVGALGELSPRRRGWFLAGTGALAAAVAALALLARQPAVVAWFNAEMIGPGIGPRFLAAQLGPLRALTSPAILKPLLLALAAAALFAWAGAARGGRLAAAPLALAAGLLAFDLISFGRGFNTVVPRALVYPATPGIELLQRQPGPFRVLLDGARGMLINSMAPFGIAEAGGYSSFYPKRTNALASFVENGEAALRGRRLGRWVFHQNFASPLIDLMNVRYILTAPDARLAHPKLREVYRGEMTIYQNLAVLPRAFAVHRFRLAGGETEALALLGSPGFDPAAEVVLEERPDAAFLAAARAPAAPPAVSIESYRPDTVRIAAELSAAGWLVLTDAWYPGWKVSVDGRAGRILHGDFNYRAVPLPAGRHQVVFSYEPASYSWGLRLTLAGVLAALALFVVPVLLARRPKVGR